MNKILKFIFAVAIIVVIIATIFFLKRQKKSVNEEVQNIKTVEVAKEKYLNIGVVGTKNFNPFLSKNRNIYELTPLIYSQLISLDENFKPKYDLTKNIRKYNEGQKVSYEITIKDANFTDGTPVTTSDIEFSLIQAKNRDTLYKNKLNCIDTLQIKDEKTIIFNLNKDEIFFEYVLTFPILKKVSEEQFVSEEYTLPIGSGKYYAKEALEDRIIFEKNENYFGEKPEIDRLYVRLYENISDLYHEFRSGNIDIMNSSRKNIEEYIGKLAYTKVEYKQNEFGYIYINKKLNGNEDFKSVVKNIVNILDYDKIIESLGFGYTNCYDVLDYGNYLLKSDIYEKEKEKYTKKIEKVQKEFEKAGIKKVNQRYVSKRSSVLELNLLYRKDIYEHIKIADEVSKSFENFGIKLNRVEVDRDEYLKRVQKGEYDIVVVSQTQSSAPNIFNVFGKDSFLNITNETIDKLLDEFYSLHINSYSSTNSLDLNSGRNIKEKEEIYSQIVNEILKIDEFIPIYRKTMQLYINGSVANYSPSNFENIFNNFNKWYRK